MRFAVVVSLVADVLVGPDRREYSFFVVYVLCDYTLLKLSGDVINRELPIAIDGLCCSLRGIQHLKKGFV